MADALDWQAYYDQQARQVFAPVNAYVDRQAEDRRARAQQQFANQNAIQVAQQQADAKEARDAAAVGMTVAEWRATQREAADLQFEQQQAQTRVAQQQAQEGSLDSRLARLGLDPAEFPDDNAKWRAIGEADAAAIAAKTPPPKPDTTGADTAIKSLFDNTLTLSTIPEEQFDSVLDSIPNTTARGALVAARDTARTARSNTIQELATEKMAAQKDLFDASPDGQAARQIEGMRPVQVKAAMDYFDIDQSASNASDQLKKAIAGLGEREVKIDPRGKGNAFKIGDIQPPVVLTDAEAKEKGRAVTEAQAMMRKWGIGQNEVDAAIQKETLAKLASQARAERWDDARVKAEMERNGLPMSLLEQPQTQGQ